MFGDTTTRDVTQMSMGTVTVSSLVPILRVLFHGGCQIRTTGPIRRKMNATIVGGEQDTKLPVPVSLRWALINVFTNSAYDGAHVRLFLD